MPGTRCRVNLRNSFGFRYYCRSAGRIAGATSPDAYAANRDTDAAGEYGSQAGGSGE